MRYTSRKPYNKKDDNGLFLLFCVQSERTKLKDRMMNSMEGVIFLPFNCACIMPPRVLFVGRGFSLFFFIKGASIMVLALTDIWVGTVRGK